MYTGCVLGKLRLVDKFAKAAPQGTHIVCLVAKIESSNSVPAERAAGLILGNTRFKEILFFAQI
jgi:hypothetical protein